MLMRFSASLLLLLLLPHPAQAQMYRWVDDSGKVHYSDQAPAPGAKNVQKQSMSAGQGSTPGLPYALQQAIRNFPVALYTSDGCKEACVRARELLNQRGVPYKEASVSDEADLARLKQLSGDNAVPVLTVGREVYKGFESGIYKTALDAAGYPATSLLPRGIPARELVTKPAPKAAPAAADAEGKPVAPAPNTAGSSAPK
jgi:glutaredoxin